MPPDTRTCPICWASFPAAPGRIYCSKKCCGAAYERRGRRRATTPAPPPGPRPQPGPQPAATRSCPHCGNPVTIVALLTTPQAARPAPPLTTAAAMPYPAQPAS